MGEYAEMMLDGTCCEGCGEYLGDAQGFPDYCASCKADIQVAQAKPASTRKERPFRCGSCKRTFTTEQGRETHAAFKHGDLLVPVLTKALQNLLNGIETGVIASDHDETFANAIKQARAAIAKATGGGS